MFVLFYTRSPRGGAKSLESLLEIVEFFSLNSINLTLFLNKISNVIGLQILFFFYNFYKTISTGFKPRIFK